MGISLCMDKPKMKEVKRKKNCLFDVYFLSFFPFFCHCLKHFISKKHGAHLPPPLSPFFSYLIYN